MGSFTITKTTSWTTFTFSCSNGVKSGTPPNEQGYLAIGASFSVTAELKPNVGTIDSAIVSWVGSYGRFVRDKDPNTGEILTSYSFDRVTLDTPSQSLGWNVSSPSQSVTAKFFLGINIGGIGDELNFQIHIPEQNYFDSALFFLNFQRPAMTMNFNYASGTNSFAFGPYKHSHLEGNNRVYDGVFLPWNDPGYKGDIATPGVIYGLGAAAEGTAPFKFTGDGTNTTSSDGSFYMTQLVKSTGYLNREYYKSAGADMNFQHGDEQSFGLDHNLQALGPGDTPWSWRSGPTVNAPAGSGLLPVPAPNSQPDINYNNQSYYSDAPSTGFLMQGDYDFTQYAPFDVHTHYQFKSYYVWHPTGGIPIWLVEWDWGVDVDQHNATSQANPNPTQSFFTPGNWVNNGTTGQTIINSSPGPGYLTWNYSHQRLTDAATSMAMATPRTRITAPAALPGLTPIGGQPQMFPGIGPPHPKPGTPQFIYPTRMN